MCPVPFLSSGILIALPGWNLCTPGGVVQLRLYSITGQDYDISPSSPSLPLPPNFKVTKTHQSYCGTAHPSSPVPPNLSGKFRCFPALWSKSTGFTALNPDHNVKVTWIEGTNMPILDKPEKSDQLSKIVLSWREMAERKGRVHFRATWEPFMWVLAIKS